MTGAPSRLTFWVLAAIFVTAAATNANDYSFLVPRQDVRMAMHTAVIDGSAPASARYRVLVPYLVEPVVRLLAPRMTSEVAFRRVYALYYLSALTALFAALYWYLSVWFSDVQALVGSLFVGSTIRIVLRQGEYLDLSSIPTASVFSPSSLIEPIAIATGLLLIVKNQRWLLAVLIAIASLNSEAALLLPVVYILTRPASRETMLTGLGYVVASGFVLVMLRVLLGSAPVVPEPLHLQTAAINLVLFLGPVWLLAAFGVMSAPVFVRRAALAIPLYLFAVITMGPGWDLRLMTPLYPLVLPLAWSALFVPREGAR
jgi:hypothetical protein